MKLTIVTPTRNAAEYLDECAQSVRGENSPGITVKHLIVDSGSKDETLTIARRNGLEVLHVDPIGVAHSTNQGYIAAAANSDVVGFLGADDTLLRNTATLIADWYERRANTWLVGGIRWVDQHGNLLGDFKPPPRWMSVEMYASLGWSCIPYQASFMTPEFFELAGLMDPSLQYADDYDYLARALSVAPFDRTSRMLSTSRMHASQLSMAPSPDRKTETERVIAQHAPESAARRWFYRYLLKVWLNGASPGWFIMKHTARTPREMLRQAEGR